MLTRQPYFLGIQQIFLGIFSGQGRINNCYSNHFSTVRMNFRRIQPVLKTCQKACMLTRQPSFSKNSTNLLGFFSGQGRIDNFYSIHVIHSNYEFQKNLVNPENQPNFLDADKAAIFFQKSNKIFLEFSLVRVVSNNHVVLIIIFYIIHI